MSYSVIIPVYNAERTLRRCLDSITSAANKCQQEVEIILVDDGSVDQSGAICREYSERNASDKIKIVYSYQENAGPGAARNTGLSAATGKYIVFVDSDDYITVDYFSVLESLPNADLVEFDYVKNDSNSSSDYEEISIKDFVANRSGAVHSKRFKLNIIEQNKITFPLDLYIGEDVVFCLCYSLNVKTAIKTKAQLYHYDESQQGSLTRHYKDDACEQAMRIYGYEFDAVKKCNLPQDDKQELLRLFDYNYCRTMFVDVEELFKRKPGFSVKEFLSREKGILSQYKSNKEKWYKPINVTHFFTQICVVWKLGLIAFTVSLLHYCLRLFRNQ